MKTVDVHEAKTHFSRLLDEVAAGESVLLARAGKPVAKMVPLDEPVERPRRRLDFLAGRIEDREDFDTMGREEIAKMFGVDER